MAMPNYSHQPCMKTCIFQPWQHFSFGQTNANYCMNFFQNLVPWKISATEHIFFIAIGQLHFLPLISFLKFKWKNTMIDIYSTTIFYLFCLYDTMDASQGLLLSHIHGPINIFFLFWTNISVIMLPKLGSSLW